MYFIIQSLGILYAFDYTRTRFTFVVFSQEEEVLRPCSAESATLVSMTWSLMTVNMNLSVKKGEHIVIKLLILWYLLLQVN